MRSFETFLLIVVLGILTWMFRDRLPLHSFAYSAPAAAPVPVLPTNTATNAHVRAGKHPARVESDGASNVPASTTVVEVVVPKPQFPDATQLKPGMTGGDVRLHFGEPSVRIMTADRGEISERYFYVDKDRSRMTVANLQGGVVVSAESNAPTGLANRN